MKDRTGKKTGQKNSTVPFYGALKSKNEIYFQMASVFKAVSRDENRLAGEWMQRILMSAHPDSPGNILVNGI